MIDTDDRQCLTMLKRIKNDESFNIPCVGDFVEIELRREYEESRYYIFVIDRTQEDIVQYSLIQVWSPSRNTPVYSTAFVCNVFHVNNASQYSFELGGKEVELEELQEELVIADYFTPLDLFDENSEENIYKQAQWVMAMSGIRPFIYDYDLNLEYGG